MNNRTVLGMVGLVAVAVTVGVVAGLTLGGGSGDGAPAEATPTVTATATPAPTATPALTTVSTATTTPAPTPTGTPDPAVSPVAVEYQIYKRVNYLRTTRGYDQLGIDESLREVARYHSEMMADRGYLGHEGPRGETLADRLARFGLDCESSTETVGRATYGTPIQRDDGTTVTYDTAEEVARAIVARWMDQANPRSEILRIEWTAMAVGVHTVDRGEGTVVYATQNLCETASGSG